ncbi:cutinase family protein [Streptomyces sp. NPDC049915]|uniref:cutinase family protein n=1 Tax=Streptomyces sp. NPDC049915 TaxID=3155510 RepID=UPI003435D48E
MPVLAVAIALLTPSTASAQGEAIALSPTQGPVNTRVTVHGTGWQDYFSRGLDVPINIGSQQLADAHPDSSGEFTVTITIPESTPLGVTRIDAILGNGGSASASFTVTESGSVPPSTEEEPSTPPLDLSPGETSEGSAQLTPQLPQQGPAKRCDKGVRIVYVPGFKDDTDGSWAAGPLSDALTAKGVKVLNDPSKLPDKIDYLAVHGGLPQNPSVISDGRDKLLAHLKGLPSDVCIALIGYSTGAVAIEKALDIVPSDVGARIVSVELFANPRNIVVESPVNKTYIGRVVELCSQADPLCSRPPRGTPLAEQIKKCKDAFDRGKGLDAGPCAAPGHLPDAYEDEARTGAGLASLLVTGSTTGGASHTVASGDTLWDLAANVYGDASRWRLIYDANRSLIEEAARQHGFSSSDDGHWIFPATSLVVPSAG